MTTKLLAVTALDVLHLYARTHHLAVCVDGMTHEVVRINGNTASVTFACVPDFAVLVDPQTPVFGYDEVDVDCMACLAVRVRP